MPLIVQSWMFPFFLLLIGLALYPFVRAVLYPLEITTRSDSFQKQFEADILALHTCHIPGPTMGPLHPEVASLHS